MADKDQRLVLAILDFLQASIQKGKVKEDDREGIEVAVQCIGEAFGVDPNDAEQRSKLTVSPNSLESIFDVYLKTRDKLSATAASASTSTPAPTTSAPSAPSSSVDKSVAETHKQRGNTLMTSKSFQQAAEAYTAAIDADNTNPVYYSNRAAAYSSMDQHDKAIEDANKAIELDPAFVRAYSRLGHAQYSIGDFKAATESFSTGLQLDPTNTNLKSGLENSRARSMSSEVPAVSTRSGAPGGAAAAAGGGLPDLASLAGMMGGGAGGGGGGGGMPDLASLAGMMGGGPGAGGGGMPDLASLMQNPMLMQMAQSMMANGGMERMMQNPSVRNMAERMQGGGGIPSMAEIMGDPSLRDLANQFMGPGAGRGAGPPPGNV